MASRVATLRLQMMDGVSGPAKKTSGALGQLERDIGKLGKNGAPGAKRLIGDLEHLRQKAAAVGQFREMRRGMTQAFAEFRNARSRVKELEAALSSVAKPTAKMTAELRTAKSALKASETGFRQARSAAMTAGEGLKSFGLNSRTAANAQGELRRSMAQTIGKMRELRKEAKKPIPPMASPLHQASGGRVGRLQSAAAVGAGGGAVGAVLAQPLKKAVSYDELTSRVAATLSGGGTLEQKRQAKLDVSNAIDHSLKVGGGSRDSAAEALDRLVASGVLEPKEALAALPTVTKTAYASGASPDDVAAMSVAMLNNGVSISQLQEGLDRALRAGQLGGVELKQMAKWMPQLLALAKGSGLTGLEAVTWLAAGSQTSLTTAGSADEAANNLVNLLQKLNSRELQKTLADVVKTRKGDPLTPDKEFDWQRYMVQRRQAGVSGPEALSEILDRQLEDNVEYQKLRKKAESAATPEEQKAALQGALNIAEASSIGEVFADRQALGAALALSSGRDRQKRLEGELQGASGATDRESEFIREQAFSKLQDAANAADRANEQVFKQLEGPLGSLAENVVEAAEAFPGLTTAIYGLGTAMTALAAGGALAGFVGGRLGSGPARRAAARAKGGSPVSNAKASAKPGIGGLGGLAAGAIGAVGVVQTASYLDDVKKEQLGQESALYAPSLFDIAKLAAMTTQSALKRASSEKQATDQKASLEADIMQSTSQWPLAAQQGIRAYVGELMTGGAEAEAKATAIGEQIKQLLTIDGKLSIDVSQLEHALSLSRQLASAARGGVSAVSPSGSLDPKLDGKRASGGPVKAGGIYQINERGQELFAPGADGTIIPHHKVGQALGGGGGAGGGNSITLSFSQTVHINGGGADANLPAEIAAAAKSAVQQAVSELDGKLARSMQTTFGNLSYGDA
ncbi:phage tail tape measure protein [Brucella sp. 21LCYQ03]|nr:phage tail tape measure protein [Brucella sp. 21LCYQ03]